MKLTKLRKFTSWSGTKFSKEKRQAGKGKTTPLPAAKKNASSSCSSNSFHNGSKHENVSAAKEENKLIRVNEANQTTTQPGVLSNMEEDRPCFLFEDNEDDNINDKNFIPGNPDFKHPQTAKLVILAPGVPNADHAIPHISSQNNLFHPPQEIMVDHLAVPPSPMREPNVNVITSPSMGKRLLDDYHPGIFLNFQESSSPREITSHNHCLGDPVGDIAMQRQLMDAQRLVRIILGKPLNKDNDEILGASSILQAIRSYALMKAELIGLRKKQEIIDGDPPAILQTIGSPTATTPSTTRTDIYGSRMSRFQKGISNCDSLCESMGHQSAQSNADLDFLNASALEQANQIIKRLQAELTTANRAIVELTEGGKDCQTSTQLIHQIEPTEQHPQNDQQPGELVVEEMQQDENLDEDGHYCRDTKEFLSEIDCSQQLIPNDEHHDETVLEETKQDGSLDLLLDEIVLIPQRILTKDMVREKLELYYHSIAQNSSENEILEIKKVMRHSQEESDRRILEMENKLKLQDQEHKEQLLEIILNKERIADTQIKQKQTTVLKELSDNT